MYCKMCGNKMDEDSKFCVNCGNAVEEKTEEDQTVENDKVVENDTVVENDKVVQNNQSVESVQPVQSVYYQQPVQSVYYQQPVQNTTDYNTLSIVFGIISIVFCWSFTLLTLGFGIAAIVISNKHKNQYGKSGAGKVLGILGIIFSSLILLFSMFMILIPIFAAVFAY